MRNFLKGCLLFLTSCVSPSTDLNKTDNTKLYDNVVVEVATTGDYSPSSRTLCQFKAELEALGICNSSNVYFMVREPVPTLTDAWTISLINDFENRHRLLYDYNPRDRLLIMFISCLPGTVIEKDMEDVIGLQYGVSSFTYFTRNRNDLLIWLHEFGHMIGLVDSNKRLDPPINPDRPEHCNDYGCIMFWRLGATSFCDLCREDIKRMIRTRSRATVSQTRSGY